MDLFLAINHLFSLLVPALAVGCLLALLARLLFRGGAARRSWLRQSLMNALGGVCGILCGLLFFGHDGKMASYLAMVVLCATMQFVTTKPKGR